eukprot:15455264-Alexandrium_andersonii.AAC.1
MRSNASTPCTTLHLTTSQDLRVKRAPSWSSRTRLSPTGHVSNASLHPKPFGCRREGEKAALRCIFSARAVGNEDCT